MATSKQSNSAHELMPGRPPLPASTESPPDSRTTLPVGIGSATEGRRVPTLILMVGLPAAGKTTRAIELATARGALRLTPDEWLIPLIMEPMTEGTRMVLEGRLISVALQALRLGTSAVLDFGLWSREERSALRWLAGSNGATCEVIYLPVDRDTQLARIEHRQETAPQQTLPISEADTDEWRMQFQVPDTDEFESGPIPAPPDGWTTWAEWAADHWPTCTDV